MKNAQRQASRFLSLLVLVIVGGAFVWWAKRRPAFLEFQALNSSDTANQSALVAKYQRELKRKDLSREDEIRLRYSLGEIYVRSLRSSDDDSMMSKKPEKVESPYVPLAKEQFDRVIALDPDNADAHAYLGWIYWCRNLETYAMQELNLARRLKPKKTNPTRILAKIKLERGQAAEARELALEAIADGDDGNARMTLIYAYIELGEPAAALEQFNSLSPESLSNPRFMITRALALMADNQWAEAIRTIDQAQRLQPNDGWVAIHAGRIMLEAGQYEQASGYFAQAGRSMPDSLWPRVFQIETFYRRGDCDSADRLGTEFADWLSDWCWSYMMKAWIQLCKGDTQRALLSLGEASRLAPDLFEPIRLRAEVLTDQMRFDELGEVIRPLLDQKKHQSEAYALLARSFMLQKKRSLTQEMADSAIKLDRRNAFAFEWLAMSRAELKDRQGMKFAFDMAKQLRPLDKTIQAADAFYRASVFSEPGAGAELQKLINDNRRIPELWIFAGDYSRRNKNWTDAINAYQSALALKPYSLAAHLGLIDALWQNGMTEQADVQVGAALEINSKNPEVLAWRAKIRKAR